MLQSPGWSPTVVPDEDELDSACQIMRQMDETAGHSIILELVGTGLNALRSENCSTCFESHSLAAVSAVASLTVWC